MDFTIRRNAIHAAVNGSAYSDSVTNLKLPGSRILSPTSTPRPSTPRSHEQSLSGGWIVQKFGGTSVGKFADQIAKDIVRAGLQDDRIAVVCSARSSSTKSEGTTNRLLRAAEAARSSDSGTYTSLISALQEDHVKHAKALIHDPSILEGLSNDIESECADLLRVLQAAQHLGEVSPGTEDKIVSKGEALACRFLAALLQDSGVKSAFVDMADILPQVPATPGAGGLAQIPRIDEMFYARVAKLLGDAVRTASGSDEASEGDPRCVPVITGYFGRVPGGLLNSIGRGYTDLCAALVAVGLRAKELQVWKEVDGIFTADPRKVPTARLLEAVTPSEAAELTFYGSEVIHPFTMEQVIRASIPIRIKNVMNPRNKGTMIFPDASSAVPSNNTTATASANPYWSSNPSTPTTSPRKTPPTSTTTDTLQGSRLHQHKRNITSTSSTPIRTRPKRPTAVTVKHNCVILNVHSNKRTRAHGFLMNIFRVLDTYGLTVDLISSSEVHVSMALHSEKGMLASASSSDEVGFDGTSADGDSAAIDIRDQDLLGAVQELREFGTIDLVNNMAIVSLVGKQLRNMVGISGRFFKTLGDNHINIEMISQGASEINISCVIDEREADRALNVLHTSLFTFLD